MSYEMVMERIKAAPVSALEEIYAYADAVCRKYEKTPSVEDGLAFIEKYAGKITRDIDCKAEKESALDEKYGTVY